MNVSVCSGLKVILFCGIMRTSASKNSMPFPSKNLRTSENAAGSVYTSYTSSSVTTSSAPASMAYSVTVSSSRSRVRSMTSRPLLLNMYDTQPVLPSSPPHLERVLRTSPAVRFLLSVSVLMISALPPTP